MMDRTAQAVFRAGYDLDDVVVERFVVCQSNDGTEVRVPAEPLSDSARLKKKIASALKEFCRGAMIRAIVVEGRLDHPPQP
ncbi:MAG: hypothetical protein AABZ47_08560 [Planctomycetota bacterium]